MIVNHSRDHRGMLSSICPACRTMFTYWDDDDLDEDGNLICYCDIHSVDPVTLNSVMEFDHVVEVRADGLVQDRPDIWAPELHDGDLDTYYDKPWELLDGYSGQYRYSGPIMHPSEFIGGQMARDILNEPGIYVALVNYPIDDDEPDGWAVARMEES